MKYTQSALQCIFTPVTGFNINPALIVHHLNSLGSILARCHFRGTHITSTNFRFLPGTHLYTWVENPPLPTQFFQCNNLGKILGLRVQHDISKAVYQVTFDLFPELQEEPDPSGRGSGCHEEVWQGV